MSRNQKFFEGMRSFVTFFLIFGLWPSWKEISDYKIVLIGYSIFSILLVVGVFISAIVVNKVLDDNTLSTAIAYSFLLSILATHLIIVLQALFYRKTLVRLMNKFAYVDKLFSNKLQIQISYGKECKAMWIRFVLLLSTFVLIKLMLIAHLHQTSRLSIFWYHCLFSIWLLRLRCVQVLFFIYLLRSRLLLVNGKLKEILTAIGVPDDIHDGILSKSKNTIFVLDNLFTRHTVYDRLLYLKQIYAELYEICELINITFGWSLLAITTQAFIDFTSNSYWTFLALEQQTPDIGNAFDCISLLVPIVIILITMAYYCSSCTRSVCSLHVRRLHDFHLN